MIKIKKLSIADAPLVFDFVLRLLIELGEEGEELRELNHTKVIQAWKEKENSFHVFAAMEDSKAVGLLTLNETFAIYANGKYGVIDEMYVIPSHRSTGIGKQLVDAAIEFGRNRDWSRVDVTAPESGRWERTRRFYEKQGFIFTGPKLKLLLKG